MSALRPAIRFGFHILDDDETDAAIAALFAGYGALNESQQRRLFQVWLAFGGEVSLPEPGRSSTGPEPIVPPVVAQLVQRTWCERCKRITDPVPAHRACGVCGHPYPIWPE